MVDEFGSVTAALPTSGTSSRHLLDLVAGRERLASQQDIPDELMSLAVRHGLVGIMATSTDQQTRVAAQPVFARLATRQAVMESHLQRLLAALHEQGVRATVLKGPHLSRCHYANPFHRTFTDVDLLVRADEVDAALRVISVDDAIPAIPAKTPKADKRNIPVVDESGVAFNLDLHWDLFSYSQLRGSARGATEWAWRNARLDRDHVLGPMWELPKEAMISFLGTHAVLDHRFRLILFRDLAEVAARFDDWESLREFAQRWSLRSTTYVALLLAVQIAEADIPASVLDELRPSSLPVSAVEHLVRRTDLVHFDGHEVHPLNLAMVLLHDDRAERMRLLLQAPVAFPAWRKRVGASAPSLSSARRHSRDESRIHRSDRSLTLHVLPVDIARGAQRYAEALSRTLDGEVGRHRTVTIFQSDPIALHADIELGVPTGWRRSSGFDPVAAWRLLRLVKRLKPNVVVAHGGESLKYAALAASGETRLVYYKIGTSQVHLSKNQLRRALYQWLTTRCDIVAGVSREMVDEALEMLDTPRQQAIYVPNGRNPDPFLPWKGSETSSVRFVFVGHVTRTKRPERFVDVVQALSEAGLDVDGVLIGDGPMLASIEEQARGTAIDVLGRRDDVPDILSMSDVFLFTSLEEGEGMPGVLIEASLAGLPVVTTEVPGARTVIDNDVTGFVVPVDDFDAMVTACRNLVEDPDLRRRMGKAGRERAQTHFTLEASVDEWRRLLEPLVDRSAVE